MNCIGLKQESAEKKIEEGEEERGKDAIEDYLKNGGLAVAFISDP